MASDRWLRPTSPKRIGDPDEQAPELADSPQETPTRRPWALLAALGAALVPFVRAGCASWRLHQPAWRAPAPRAYPAGLTERHGAPHPLTAPPNVNAPPSRRDSSR
jgi:hypothetical protein